MSFQYADIQNVRRTEWLYARIGAGSSCYLRDGEQWITNLEWCRREVEWLAAKGIEAQVRYNAIGQVAVFATAEYTNYRVTPEEESYESDPTDGSAIGGGQGAAPVQEPELPDIESM